MKIPPFVIAAIVGLSMAFVAPQARADLGVGFCVGSFGFDAVHDKDQKHVLKDSVFRNVLPCAAAIGGVVVGGPPLGIALGFGAREITRDHRAGTSHYPGVFPESIFSDGS